MQQIHPNKVRQIFFLLTLTVLGIFIAQHLLFLLAPLLGAIASYVLLRNLMIKLVIQYKWKKWIAALTLILGSLLLIILPLIWVGNIGYSKLTPIIQQPDLIKEKFNAITIYVNNKLGTEAIKPSHIDGLKNGLLNQGQKVLGGTMQTLGVLGLTLLILYFMLYQTQDVEKWLRTRLPFRDKNKSKVIKKLRDLVYSNAVGVPVVAILQGIVATIGYLIFGANEPILMGILTIFAAFIPIVGGMLVYVPLGLYLLSQGFQWQGIAVICWGLVVVGSVDNIARFWLQKRMANVHPLVTIFGVIMGVEIFGFLGIIFGPILLSLFSLLTQIYLDEFGYVDADDVDHPFDKGDNF
jgi:predicted PurR-regulated permease PerM